MVMLEFSMDTPCPTTVIPAMDKMHDELTVAANNVEYSPALWAALSMARTLLDKYYFLRWDDKWINTMEKIIKDEFKCSYKDYTLTKSSAGISKKVCFNSNILFIYTLPN